MRSVLNVAVIAIINPDDKNKDYPTYPEWKPKKNLMLSSFFWGYICLQIGAGQLAKNYGPKRFLCCAIFITSLFTILTPVLGGVLGQALGNVFSMPITGIICNSKLGWPVAFYTYGALGICWCILWILLGADSPSKHKSISRDEKDFIESSLMKEEDISEIPTPWKSIFTSLPVMAIIVTHCGQNWGFWTLLTEIPSFMENILHENISSNSLLSALPYFVMWFMTLVFSPIADLVIDKKFVSVITSRKIFNSIGLAFPAVALISLCFIDTKWSTISLLVIAMGFNAAQYSGFNINHIDLSPIHAGTLMAITNSFATICSILAPLAVDLIRIISGFEENDKTLWNIVFCTTSGIYLFAMVFYILFASGDLQPWNFSDPKVAERPSVQDKVKLRILRKISVISTA
ncbi:unnamed protein product [Diabrotica balteata]|uniref:Inorganic phosphate cotransporter n=1 Tax=Diabrotica balteata TaxID=107213 RepID=A0A9P0E1X8_DIABA|nr:unnamed protein product [Diabrotica balteata]